MSKVILFASLLFAQLSFQSKAHAQQDLVINGINTATKNWCVEQSFSTLPDKNVVNFCLSVVSEKEGILYRDDNGVVSVKDKYSTSFNQLNADSLTNLYHYTEDYFFVNNLVIK